MRSVLPMMIAALAVLGCTAPKADGELPSGGEPHVMQIHYLEIVTPDVDALCAVYAAANGLEFGEPVPGFGFARTAPVPGGGMVGVRAPMRDSEDPVVRPYWLVDDIEAALAAVDAAGSVVALPPTEIPGGGTFAIYIEGGVDHGLWQLPATDGA